MCMHTELAEEFLQKLSSMPSANDAATVLSLALGYYLDALSDDESEARSNLATMSRIAMHIWGRERGIDFPMRMS